MIFDKFKPGDIVHLIGGITEYAGEISLISEEKMGYWVSIKNPCILMMVQKGNQMLSTLSILGGPEYVYEHHVILYLPKDSLIEIRVLDREGGLYALYKKQAATPKYEGVLDLPGSPGYDAARQNLKAKDKNKFRPPLKH